MTILQIIKGNLLQTEVDEIKRYSSIDIDYVTKDGVECETQLDVDHHVLTKAGMKELDELFGSLAKELNTTKNSVISCTVVASAETYEKLIKIMR